MNSSGPLRTSTILSLLGWVARLKSQRHTIHSPLSSEYRSFCLPSKEQKRVKTPGLSCQKKQTQCCYIIVRHQCNELLHKDHPGPVLLCAESRPILLESLLSWKRWRKTPSVSVNHTEEKYSTEVHTVYQQTYRFLNDHRQTQKPIKTRRGTRTFTISR